MLHALLLAGGSGTRFWPKSRKSLPKQFLSFAGASTLIEQTVDRLQGLVEPERIWVVTSREHRKQTCSLLPGVPAAQVLGEPEARDTAVAIALGNRCIRAADPQATLLVLPADHVISPRKRWQESARVALEALKSSPRAIVVFGVRALGPATGYGYIERGASLELHGAFPVHEVARFHEKPDPATAEDYVRRGFLWNSGMFCFHAEALAGHVARLEPKLGRVLDGVDLSKEREEVEESLERAYQALPSVNFDRAIVTPCTERLVVVVDYEWDDVGTFSALARHLPADGQGNQFSGAVVSLASSNNLVDAGEGCVALCGVEGLIVVHTEDATLVCRREDAERVKDLLDKVKSLKKGERFI